MRTLFFFTEYYEPAQNSTAYFLTRIIGVARRFHGKIQVICATPGPQTPSEDTENFSVFRVAVGHGDKNNLKQRIQKFLVISWNFFRLAFLHVRRNDVVFAVTNPAFIIFILAVLRSFRRFEYILLAYDIFPENLVAAGLARQKSFHYRVVKKIFDWSYSRADRVIVIGRDMANILKNKGVENRRLLLIPNWSDCSRIQPTSPRNNPYLCQLGIQNKKVFLFAGNIGRVQGIDNLLTAITLVKSKQAVFLFIGSGAMADTVRMQQAESRYHNIYYLEPLPLEKQPEFLNACDVAIVTLGTNMLGLGVPSKSYFSMAAGKPLLYIGEHDSEIAQVIAEEQCGWQVEPHEPARLAELIDLICALPEEKLTAAGQAARRTAEKRFSETVIQNRYGELFTSLNHQEKK